MTDPAETQGRSVRAPAIKICGLTRRQDAELAARAGADFLGIVLVPGTPRALSAEVARDVLAGLAPPAVAVVANLPLDRTVTAAQTVGASVLQLHGEEPPNLVGDLKGLGQWKVWKAIRVKCVEDILRGLDAYGAVVDGILLDGWHPRLRGGSGTPFSWGDVAEIRGRFPDGVHLIAAGGLNPENVEEAILRLDPHVVDVSSGVEESPGIKNSEKLRAFVRNARRVR